MDTSTLLMRAERHVLWVHPTDQHSNERAHEIAAKRIAPFAAMVGEDAVRPGKLESSD